MRGRWLMAMVAALLSVGGPAAAGVDLVPSAQTATATPRGLCGKRDLPETGIQGDVPRADQDSGRARRGYNCGLALLGHTTLGAGERPPGGNANMAWAGHCAYVAGAGNLDGSAPSDAKSGVAVIDVSDPAAPRHVATLRTPGAQGTLETLHAVETADRAILAVGRYGALSSRTDAPVDLYDVRNCAEPVLLASFTFPQNVHNLTLSRDGTRLFSTLPLAVMDISDPPHPRFLGNLEDAIPDKGLKVSVSHEAWPSADGRLVYVAGQMAQDDGTLTNDGILVLDISRWPQQPPVVLGKAKGPGHSIRTARLGTRTVLVHSDESPFPAAYGCLPTELTPWAGPAQTYLSDVTDPGKIAPLGELRLAINDVESCPAQLASRVDASVHYHDVDAERNSRFVVASMFNAGVRLFDIRDPRHPVEVAYFNPADVGGDTVVLDQAWGHIRYVPRTGHLWFATASGGFWVVEIEPQVRKHLGLKRTRRVPKPAGAHPEGRLGTDGLEPAAAASVSIAEAYCTLAPATAAR